MYYNTRPVRRPLMDLIDFHRVPESAGQTHYFSKDLSSPPSSPLLSFRYVFRRGAVAS